MKYINNFFITFTLEKYLFILVVIVLISSYSLLMNLFQNIKFINNKILQRLIIYTILRRCLVSIIVVSLIYLLKYDILDYTINIFNKSFSLSENYIELILQVSLTFLGISISILALTHIFKEKIYNMEFLEIYTNKACGFKVVNNLKMVLVINIALYVMAIVIYQFDFYYSIFAIFILNMFSAIYVINYLFNYIFNTKRINDKVRGYIVEYYLSLPLCYKKDYGEFTDELFEYGNKLEQHEFAKTLDYIRLIFKIYEIIINKYIEFNSEDIPDRGILNVDRDTMADNADNSMFLKSYYIANICQLLYNFMKKDNKRGFERIINMIYMNHITFFNMDYLDVCKMIDIEKNIWAEDMVNFSFEGQMFNIKNINTYFKKSIIFEWKYALEKIFLCLDDYEMFYQNKIKNLLSYVELLLKELEDKYKEEKELEKLNKEKVNNYD